MIHIAIVEDSRVDASTLKTFLNRYSQENNRNFNIDYYPNAIQFLDQFQGQYDLIFMDIDMPGQNGMDAAKTLRTIDNVVTLIFITNLTQYAIKGYEVDAIDYILKPIDYYSFAMKLKKAITNIKKQTSDKIMIPFKNGFKRLSISTIYYVEIITHQLIFHTEQGDIEVRGTMKDTEKALKDYSFYRCNNSFLVNMKHITALVDNTLTVGHQEVQISRPKKKAFMKAYNDYLGGTL